MEKFNIDTYEPRGELTGFPKEVIKKMLERQVEQVDEEDISVFEVDTCNSRTEGAFDWWETIEGADFWFNVIDLKNFDVFFEKYPKKEETSIYQQMNDRDGSTVESVLEGIGYTASILQENVSVGNCRLVNVDIANLIVLFERLYALDPERRKVVERHIEKIENKL